MGAWIKILTVAADVIANISEWWKKRKRTNEVDSIEKSVDNSDDKSIAEQLRRLAKKIENRRKSD